MPFFDLMMILKNEVLCNVLKDFFVALTTHLNCKFTWWDDPVDPFIVRFLNKVHFQCIVCVGSVLDFWICETITDSKTLEEN